MTSWRVICGLLLVLLGTDVLVTAVWDLIHGRP